MIVTSAFMGLAVLTVALRLYTRVYVVKAPGLDDLIIIAALVCISIDYAYHNNINISNDVGSEEYNANRLIKLVDLAFFAFIILGKWSIPAMPLVYIPI